MALMTTLLVAVGASSFAWVHPVGRSPVRVITTARQAHGDAASQDYTKAAADGKMLSTIQRMRATGMSEENVLGNVELSGAGGKAEPSSRAGSCPPQGAPSQGRQEWGSWSHTQEEIALEISLPEDVRTKDLVVEVVEGWLLAAHEQQTDTSEADVPLPPPLLFGRLAQPVVATELMWGVDDDTDGRRLLTITLPKKDRGRVGAAQADCIFDESLHVGGEPCIQPGLSQGTITLDLPSIE